MKNMETNIHNILLVRIITIAYGKLMGVWHGISINLFSH